MAHYFICRNCCCRKKECASSGNTCDCCVYPLQFILKQLVGQHIALVIDADTPNPPPELFQVTLLEVKNFLATVTDGVSTFIVPISNIVAIAFAPDIQINLVNSRNICGECSCTERPLREQFDTLIGSTVSITTVVGIESPYFTVTKTGLGVVLGNQPIGEGQSLTIAISLCKTSLINLNPVIPDNNNVSPPSLT